MNDAFEYFPILRWKQGEQGAVKNLGPAVRQAMLPIAELQKLEPDANHPKLIRVLKACGADKMPVAIDTRTAVSGKISTPATVKAVKAFQAAKLHAWPTLHGAEILADPKALALLKNQPAVVLRINPMALSLADAIEAISVCQRVLGPTAYIYTILDLGAIGDLDVNGAATVLARLVAAIDQKCHPRQIAMAGGSFPMTLGSYRLGVNNYIPRKELTIWKALRAMPRCGKVKFGDYAVTNPEPVGIIDPRAMNPAAAIRYCLEDQWWLLRASGVRTNGKGGMKQYNALCKLLIADKRYCNAAFSYGDERYTHHAQTGASSGNFTTWRRDAVSHHLTFTAHQLLPGIV